MGFSHARLGIILLLSAAGVACRVWPVFGSAQGEPGWEQSVFFITLLGCFILFPTRKVSLTLLAATLGLLGLYAAVRMLNLSDVGHQVSAAGPVLHAALGLGVVAGLTARIRFRPAGTVLVALLLILYVRYRDPEVIAVASFLVALALLLIYSHLFFENPLTARPAPGARGGRGEGNAEWAGNGGGAGNGEAGATGSPPPGGAPGGGQAVEEDSWSSPLGVGAKLKQVMSGLSRAARPYRGLISRLCQLLVIVVAVGCVLIGLRHFIEAHLSHLAAISVAFVVWLVILAQSWKQLVAGKTPPSSEP